jgi:cell division protein FtsZ
METFDNITFDLPKNRSNVIKVIGVGGGGSNALNYMYQTRNQRC